MGTDNWNVLSQKQAVQTEAATFLWWQLSTQRGSHPKRKKYKKKKRYKTPNAKVKGGEVFVLQN